MRQASDSRGERASKGGLTCMTVTGGALPQKSLRSPQLGLPLQKLRGSYFDKNCSNEDFFHLNFE